MQGMSGNYASCVRKTTNLVQFATHFKQEKGSKQNSSFTYQAQNKKTENDCSLSVRFVSPWVPGHALHEKGLQRQIGVGTLVNSQQRRALAVPVINRG